MALSDFRLALRRFWYVALAALVFWLLVGSSMAFLPSPRYESSASLVAEPPVENLDNAIQIAGYQLPVVVATLQSRSFVSSVRDDLPPTLDADVAISVVNRPGTPLISITVQSRDPDTSATWATALALAAVDEREDSVLPLRVLDEAVPSITPVSPRPVPILLGTTVLGLLSAVLAAVIAFQVRKALDLAEELERRLDLPIIGTIPNVRALRRASYGSAVDAILSSPELMEAFRSLGTNLDLALFSDVPTTLSVASWGEGEGKSTVAAGIALTSAASGQETIAVDADLRHPELHSRLSQPFGEGLADVARRDLETLIGPTGYRNLWFLPSGIPDRHPADVLAVTLEEVIRYGRAERRRLVVDPPPFHGIAETLMVLAASHNVVIVVDRRKAKLAELEAMVTRMRASGVNIIGVVLNRTSQSRKDSAYPAYAPDARHLRAPAEPLRARRPPASRIRPTGTAEQH
jgi:polysaccharide biosynthesis transport protein